MAYLAAVARALGMDYVSRGLHAKHGGIDGME
jgi:hypothetical protein